LANGEHKVHNRGEEVYVPPATVKQEELEHHHSLIINDKEVPYIIHHGYFTYHPIQQSTADCEYTQFEITELKPYDETT